MTTAHHSPARPPSAPGLATRPSVVAPVSSNSDPATMEGHAEAVEHYRQLGFTAAEAEGLEYRAGLFHLRRGLSLHAAGMELNEAATIAEQYPGGMELFIQRSTQKPATVELACLVADHFTAEEAGLLSIMTWLALFSAGRAKGLLLARTLITERQNGSLEPTKQEIESRLKRLKPPAAPPVEAHPGMTIAAPESPVSMVPTQAMPVAPTGGVDRVAGQITSARALPLPLPPPPKKGNTGKRPTPQARQAAGPLRPLIAPDMEPATFAALATAYAQELLAQTAASTMDALPAVRINQAELTLAVSLLRQSNLFRHQLNQSWQREATTTEADEEPSEQEPAAPEDGDEPA